MTEPANSAPHDSAAEQPDKSTAWSDRLPFRWFTQEDSYRDLTANTLAAGIVAIIGYLYAIGAGIGVFLVGPREAW
jgi:hypothetical protein